MGTAVLFLIFNRPDTTEQVFEAIRRARPPRLYVAADGARIGHPAEAERCELARRIATAIDWPCEVTRLFREANLGCRQAVSQAIGWFFEHEEEGIILEDDVMPDRSFFRYCEELLGRYRFESKVMMISGDHFHGSHYRPSTSYFFSRYTHVWGWASWRRAWTQYDVAMSQWPSARASDLLSRLYDGDRDLVSYWTGIFDATHEGEIDTWDYQWQFASMLHDGLATAPSRNLVRNLGFAADATHTRDVSGASANLPMEKLDFPLRHPAAVVRDPVADQWEEQHLLVTHAPRLSRVQRWLGALRSRLSIRAPSSRQG